MSGTRLLTIVLEQVRRGGRVMPLRRHGIHIVRVQGRLVKQGSVELVALATGIRKEGEIVIVEVGRQVSCLRLVVERQRSAVVVENSGVGQIGLAEGVVLLLMGRRKKRRRLLRAQETRVVEGLVGLLCRLIERETKTNGWIVMLIGRRRRGVRVVYMRLLVTSRKRPAPMSLSLLIHDGSEFRSKTKPRRKETT